MDKEVFEILNKLLTGQEGLISDIKEIKAQITGLKTEVNDLKTQLTENTQILKSLEHSAEINKAEHDKMQYDIAHIKGDIESIKKDLSQVELVTANNWADIVKLKAVK